MMRVLILLLVVLPATATAGVPVRVTHARADGAGQTRSGSVLVKALVDDTMTQSLAASLLSGGTTISVRDAGGFELSVPLRTCQQAGSGVRCASGATRLTLKRTADPFVYRLRYASRELGPQAAGVNRPVPPLRFMILADGTSQRVDVIGDCKPIGVKRLGCRDQDRPNIVFIVTDDQRWDTVEYMPQTLALLADQGIRFTNAFVTTPLCGPSRASMLTGNYARHHGVRTNFGGIRALIGPDNSTIATWLHDVGYRTSMIGKYMVGYAELCPPFRTSCYQPPGWDDWHVFLGQKYYNYQLSENGTVNSYGASEADYSTDVLTAKAVDFIRNAEGQPFFLHVGYHAPHGEIPFPIPAPRHAGTYRILPPAPPVLPPWRPVSFDEEDMTDKPPWMAGLPRATDRLGIFVLGNFNENTRLLQLEANLAVDEGIAEIVAALEETGQADNTVIVFVSDNGFFWGEHRLFTGKDYPYIESLRVPLLIRYPRMFPTARIEDRIVLSLDIAPTLAALAKTAPAQPIDGVNAVPLLSGDATEWRTDFASEWWGSSTEGLQDYQAVCSVDWHYIYYPEVDQRELYDLMNDPYELENQAGDPSHQEIVAMQEQRLSELFSR